MLICSEESIKHYYCLSLRYSNWLSEKMKIDVSPLKFMIGDEIDENNVFNISFEQKKV